MLSFFTFLFSLERCLKAAPLWDYQFNQKLLLLYFPPLCMCEIFLVDDQNALSLKLFVLGMYLTHLFGNPGRLRRLCYSYIMEIIANIINILKTCQACAKNETLRSSGQLEPVCMFSPRKDRAVSTIRTGYIWELPGCLFQS